MAKKKNLTPVQKAMIVGGILVLVQGAIMIYMSSQQKPMTAREVISKALEQNTSLDSRRKEQLRIQAAINDYSLSNNNAPPKSLDDLIPKYFDAVPIDPATSKPFTYRTDGKHAIVGEEGEKVVQMASVNAAGQGGPADEQQALIESLNDPATQTAMVYDPTGKRDPFRPFDLTPRHADDGDRTPLEKFEIGQLRFTAVLNGFDEPMGIVETLNGTGYPVKKGTKIGVNGGEIVEILPDKILVLETTVDFTGQKKSKTIEMSLRTKDQEDKKKGKR